MTGQTTRFDCVVSGIYRSLTLLLLLPLIMSFGCSSDNNPLDPTTPPVEPPIEESMATVEGSVFGGVDVVGATVAFIPAFEAGASNSIQPLEDLAPAATFQVATDRDGRFSIQVEAGLYYVYVTPSTTDTLHMPGGNFVRNSVSLNEGTVSILNIVLSEQPTEAATFVGSSTCLDCHPSHSDATKTLHFLGFRKLSAAGIELSSTQDFEHFPNSDPGVEYYANGNPDDNTGDDEYGYRITTADYNILLGVDATGHFQATESSDETMVSERFYIVFVYGGEDRYKQRFVTRLDVDGTYTDIPADGSYQILPGQYSETRGDPDRGGEVTVPLWVTYHAERWGAPAVDGGAASLVPSTVKSFDNTCASCHFTGMTLTKNGDGLFQAHAVADAGGPIDYDGDGELDEMNVGCERCHGPGSDHVIGGKGYIVQPEYLPPGRANLICGQCHTRGVGNGTIDGEGGGGMPYRNNPDTGDIEIQRAGISPVDFYGLADGSTILPNFGTTGGYFNPIDFTTDKHSWQDNEKGYGSDLNHSAGHRQQYLDHARAEHAHNPFEMLACWDCHTPHERERRAQVSKPFENNVLCLDCHATHGDWSEVTPEMVDDIENGGAVSQEIRVAINEHTIEMTTAMVGEPMDIGPAAYGNPGGTDQLGRCTTCHMPKTAKTASWITDEQGFVIRGDISSHTFKAISPKISEEMAADGSSPPITNSCVDCHRGIFRGAFPDYRYRAPATD